MRNNNYFEIRIHDHQDLPFETNLKLHSFDVATNTVTVSHYGARNKFRLPATIGCRRYNIDRNDLFLSFGILFPAEK